tara:strand:- start:176 stop:367 length:192 start_codon:yes stop_codon:yes gene_type:complete
MGVPILLLPAGQRQNWGHRSSLTLTKEPYSIPAEKEENRGPNGRDRIRRPAGKLHREITKLEF